MIAVYLSYLQHLKVKIPNIEKYIIYKPILLRNLKDKINELILEKSNNAKNNNNNSIIENNFIL